MQESRIIFFFSSRQQTLDINTSLKVDVFGELIQE